MAQTVSVVLNSFKRRNLKEQIDAIQNQSIRVNEILHWNNASILDDYSVEGNYGFVSALCNTNLGVWARFAYALNAKSDFVCVIDDDTIPGKRWLENCLETHNVHQGLLGGIGLRFQNSDYVLSSSNSGKLHRFGWDNSEGIEGNNEYTVQVDIVGHSWFFSRDLLAVFWREIPDFKTWSFLCGEDIHFSYMLQKYSKLKTWVPPHPKNDTSLWSSIKGSEYGNDKNATFRINMVSNEMSEYLEYCVRNGFKLMVDQTNRNFFTQAKTKSHLKRLKRKMLKNGYKS